MGGVRHDQHDVGAPRRHVDAHAAAILDPSSGRRLGRATLDKLDNALGWDEEGPGASTGPTARRIITTEALEDGDAVAAIKAQVTMLSRSVSPNWRNDRCGNRS